MTKENLGRLILESERQMYLTAKTILHNDQDCGDAIQEAIVKAFQKIDTLRQEKYAKTWLMRILINECYSLLRRESRYVSMEDQEAIVKAFQKIDTLRQEKYAKTWLMRILINECYSLLRRESRYVSMEEIKEFSSGEAEEKRDYSDLYSAVNSLKEELRIPVILYYGEDFSIREIACELSKGGTSDSGDPVLWRGFQYQGNRTDSGNYRRGGTETAFSGADAAKGQTYANGGTHMRLEEIKKELPETPDFIHRMIVEEVENQLGKKGTAVSIRTPRKKRKWSPARVAAVAALCALGFSTVAYAGYQLYTMYVEKQGKYGISAGITMEKASASLIVPDEIPQVKIQAGYIPEGMEWVDDASGKTRLFYSETPDQGGISIGTVLLDSDDTDQILTETGVIESEKRTFGSREGIYLRFQDLEQDKTFNQVIYLLCPEEYQVVIMNIGDDVTKEDAVKFAENLSFVNLTR